MRFIPFAAGLTMSLMLASLPARAGLIGGGGNTVKALFFLGAHLPADQEVEDFGSPPVVGPAPIGPGGVDFVPGAFDDSAIHVGDTQIAITNNLAAPFCTTGLPCADSFTGFELQFSASVDITGVSVDPASAADFRPNATGTHLGLQLLSPTDILVDVTGDLPAVNDMLVLDLKFPGGTGTPVPEPVSLALLAAALVGACPLLQRRRPGRAAD